MEFLYLMLNRAQSDLRNAVNRIKEDDSPENRQVLVDAYVEAIRVMQYVESELV